MMLRLQARGCHNINIVTPTHYAAHLLLALDLAAARGLACRGLQHARVGAPRDSPAADGVVDIYLPDFKYSDPQMAARYSSGADTYPESPASPSSR